MKSVVKIVRQRVSAEIQLSCHQLARVGLAVNSGRVEHSGFHLFTAVEREICNCNNSAEAVAGQSNLIAVRGFQNIIYKIIQLGGNFYRILSPVVFEINVAVGSYLVLGRIFKMNSRALLDRAVGIVHRTGKDLCRNIAHLLAEAIPVFCQGKLGKRRHARLDGAENLVRGRRPCR